MMSTNREIAETINRMRSSGELDGDVSYALMNTLVVEDPDAMIEDRRAAMDLLSRGLAKVTPQQLIDGLRKTIAALERAAVESARKKGNDWRTVARELGRADGLAQAAYLSQLLAMLIERLGQLPK